MSDELQTARLVLRRARMTDLPAINRIMSDGLSMRYWSTLPHEDIGQSRDWLRSMVEADPAHSDDFIVTLDGEVVGKLGAWKLPEIGFLIAREHWGKGVASEALPAFIERRRGLGSTELTADVDPRNHASLRLLQRHGFVETGRETGTYSVGEELCDSIYLALTL